VFPNLQPLKHHYSRWRNAVVKVAKRASLSTDRDVRLSDKQKDHAKVLKLSKDTILLDLPSSIRSDRGLGFQGMYVFSWIPTGRSIDQPRVLELRDVRSCALAPLSIQDE